MDCKPATHQEWLGCGPVNFTQQLQQQQQLMRLKQRRCAKKTPIDNVNIEDIILKVIRACQVFEKFVLRLYFN